MGIEEYIGDYGVAIAVVAGAVLIIRALSALATTWITAWRDTRKEELAVDQRRNDIEEKQVQVLDRMSDRLEQMDQRARNHTAQTHDLIIAGRREAQQSTGAALELLGEVKNAIAEVPTLTAEEVQTRVEPLFAKAQNSITRAATSLLSANSQIEQVAALLRTNAVEGAHDKAASEPEAGEAAQYAGEGDT
jgi:hypothetical protein